MTATESKWVERVAAWRESGKTASVFAEGKDFEAATLRVWASRLKTQPSVRPRLPMARVVRRASDDSPSAALELAIGDARVVLRRGFDAELLREVVAALGAAR